MASLQSLGWGPAPVPRSRIVTVTLSNGCKLPVHRDIAELVKILGDETIRRGYPIKAGQSWGYAPRRIRGGSSWSRHAWGLAIDINAPTNPMGRPLRTDMPAWMAQLWESCGWTWGGRWKSRPDSMHYEVNFRPPQTGAMIAKARALSHGGAAKPKPKPPPEVDMAKMVTYANQLHAFRAEEDGLLHVWYPFTEKDPKKRKWHREKLQASLIPGSAVDARVSAELGGQLDVVADVRGGGVFHAWHAPGGKGGMGAEVL